MFDHKVTIIEIYIYIYIFTSNFPTFFKIIWTCISLITLFGVAVIMSSMNKGGRIYLVLHLRFSKKGINLAKD